MTKIYYKSHIICTMKKKLLIIAVGTFMLLPTTVTAQEHNDVQLKLLSLLHEVVELQLKLVAMQPTINPPGIVAGASMDTPLSEVQVGISVTTQPGYLIAADVNWGQLPGAVTYEVTSDAKDSIYTTTTVRQVASTSLSIGRFYNRDAPNNCFRVSVSVDAIDSLGQVIGRGSDSIREVGEPPVTKIEGVAHAANALGALEAALEALGELAE